MTRATHLWLVAAGMRVACDVAYDDRIRLTHRNGLPSAHELWPEGPPAATPRIVLNELSQSVASVEHAAAANTLAEGTEEPAISELLASLDVRTEIADLLLELAHEQEVVPCGDPAQPLPLSAAHDAYAAVYVYRGRLSIALDPAQARRAHDRFDLKLEPRNDTTAHIHVNAEQLEGPCRDAALGLLRQAFARAFQGPRWTRGLPDRTHQRGDVCPTCFMEMPLVGPCPNCG